MFPVLPVNHLTQMNEILRNQNKGQIENNGEKQISSLSKDNNKRKNLSSSTPKTEKSSKKRSENSNQDRSIFRQSRLEILPTKRVTPLLNSRSLGTLHDRIQRERKSHTMAPLTRISGPSSTLQSKMFANIINKPIEKQINKSNDLTQKFSKISYPKSNIEMIDDDTLIIVKVRYDPQIGVLPSEDAVRKAIHNQLFNKKNKKDPIIVNFFEHPQLPKKPFPPRIALQPSRTFPFISHPPHPYIHKRNIHPVQAPKPLINQSVNIPRLPNLWTKESYPTGFNNFKPIHHRMATQQSSTTINNQQILPKRPTTVPSSTEVFRPPAIKDIPELSRENILNMLNQIPDLQGRRFNIEYAPPSAPEGYPIPMNIDTTNNTYPEPVIIDKLPSNIIQHVKSSNNPALTAALEATIRQEQHYQSQPMVSTLNVQPPTVMHHTAQPYQHVQQSRPVSSNESDSSTELSSSSEETDSEESEDVPLTKPENNLPFVGPTQNQYC